MADEKKYLDLEGLEYTLSKIDQRKANIKNPSFVGTVLINGKKITSPDDITNPEALTEEDILQVFSEITEIENMEDGSF